MKSSTEQACSARGERSQEQSTRSVTIRQSSVPSTGNSGSPMTTVVGCAPTCDPDDVGGVAGLDQHRPLTVVISTPTYCTSRFCGPVTDTVSALAARYGDRMDFVHLEVSADFENSALNPSAAEWILRGNGDGNEPWVFVVDADGVITHRFDNVANQTVLDAAIQEVLP